MSRKINDGKSRKRNVISELIELYDMKEAQIQIQEMGKK